MRVINKLPIIGLFVLPILYAGYVPAESTWHEAKTHVAAKLSSPDEMVWKMCESPDAKKVDGCVVELYQGKKVAGCYRAHKAGQFGYVFYRNLCDQFKEQYKTSRKVVCSSEGAPLEKSALKREYESVKDKHCRATCSGDASYTIDFAADSATICPNEQAHQ